MSGDDQKQSTLVPNTEALSPSTLSGVLVLLVEDEFDIAELFILILQALGAEVLLAFSANEALQILSLYQPDILISNLRLPDHDGLWLIQQIRSSRVDAQELPAIAVTSYKREFYSDQVLESGFQRFLEKPIDLNELAVDVISLIQRGTRKDSF